MAMQTHGSRFGHQITFDHAEVLTDADEREAPHAGRGYGASITLEGMVIITDHWVVVDGTPKYDHVHVIPRDRILEIRGTS